MPLVRMIISVKDSASTDPKLSVTNTLYFNVSGSVDPPNYQNLVNDLFAVWSLQTFAVGRYVDIRAYNMDDAKPRPVKAFKRDQNGGTQVTGVPQVALGLSYFADRNLPRQRGRIFTGPYNTTAARPTATMLSNAMSLAQGLSALGGVNVDWSLWSPTTSTHTRISEAWCDDSWDIIRSRKIPATTRSRVTLNG